MAESNGTTNGGTQREYLARIETTADAALEKATAASASASQAVVAVGDLKTLVLHTGTDAATAARDAATAVRDAATAAREAMTHAAVAANQAEASLRATADLKTAILGSDLIPSDHGELGRLSKTMTDFMVTTGLRESTYAREKQTNRALRISYLGVAVMAIGGIGGMIVTIFHL